MTPDLWVALPKLAMTLLADEPPGTYWVMAERAIRVSGETTIPPLMTSRIEFGRFGPPDMPETREFHRCTQEHGPGRMIVKPDPTDPR